MSQVMERENLQNQHFSINVEEELDRLVGEAEARDRVLSLVVHGTIAKERQVAEVKKEQERTTIKKETFLKYYEMSQIVSAAAEQAGIDRTTYYLWLRTDPEFKTLVYERTQGRNQLVEDKLMKLIMQDDGPSIRYYLDRKHPDYKPKGEMDISPESAQTLSTAIWEEARRRWREANGIKEEDIKIHEHAGELDTQ